MNPLKHSCAGLLALQLALNLAAQPVVLQPPGQAFGGSSLSNLCVLKQSADGTETILTVDFFYDGISGLTARILPVITDKKQAKIARWFGADPVAIGAGGGTISLRVKYFNDEPGVPAELTTDHVKVMLLSDGGNATISQGIFGITIKWGNPNAPQTGSAPPQNQDRARQSAATSTQAAPAPGKSAFVISSNTKSKVTDIDVVNRNIDRTEMTVAVEYQYAKGDGLLKMGVDVTSAGEPRASEFFSSPVLDLGHGNRRLALFPVKLNAAAAQNIKRPTLPTDRVWVYLAGANGEKSYIFQSPMLLVWHVPAAAVKTPTSR